MPSECEGSVALSNPGTCHGRARWFVRRFQVRQLPGRGLLEGLLVLCFLVVLFRTAWVTEDAYIMFRAIDNFWHGHGLNWNIDERVQVFTCPLWCLLLTAAVGVTGEFYLTTLVACAFASGLPSWCFTDSVRRGRAAS